MSRMDPPGIYYRYIYFQYPDDYLPRYYTVAAYLLFTATQESAMLVGIRVIVSIVEESRGD